MVMNETLWPLGDTLASAPGAWDDGPGNDACMSAHGFLSGSQRRLLGCARKSPGWNSGLFPNMRLGSFRFISVGDI